MRLKLLRIITGICCFLILSGKTSAQSCIPTNINGTTINLLCNQVCSTLLFRIPHIKGTDDYAVNPIPYNPFPFTTPTGTAITSIYIDDKYSALTPMGFSFCFYGTNYTDMVVGSNGIVTFEQICANASNAYTLSVSGVPQPIPYNGGAAPSGIATTYYPRTAIMGAYHDIDPSATPLPTRRIEYNLTGTAPCRKLVVSFFDIRMFSCTSMICTEQIVMHESTGIIDVYLQDKPLCTTWPSGAAGGLAILGIQDQTRTKAVAAPGKNCTQWSESNTGYRFTPSGPGSRYVSSQLFTLTGTLVASADTSTTTQGLLDISFPNICPPAGSNQYEVVTTFSACDNPSNLLVSRDTITINRTNSIGATYTKTDATCGPPNGSITVSIPAGVGTAPFSYVLDGGVPVVTAALSHTFTGVASGPHIITITDASTGCTSTLNVTINLLGNLTATTASVATACTGVNNGTITVTPTIGVAPYNYVIDGGAPVSGGSPYTFTGLSAGSHTITFTDANNCTSNPIVVNITTGTGVTTNVTQVAATCTGSPTGSITINATAGTAPFTFQLDAGAPQSGASPYTFNGVTSGTHTVIVRDNLGCTRTTSITVGAGTGINATAAATATSCPAAANGTIVANATTGVAPFTYQLDAGAPQSGANPYTFNGVTAGAHTVIIRDNLGCTRTLNVNVSAGAALAASAVSSATSCSGAVNGSILVTPTNGSAPYTFALDGAAAVGGTAPYTFSNVAAGPHTVVVTDAVGCITNTINVNVAAGAQLAASTTSLATSCNGATNGAITVTPTNGNAPYTFSIDGGAAIAAAAPYTFTNVAAGPHTIVMTDGAGCVTNTINVTVTAGPALTTTANETDVLCFGGATGTITVAQPTIGNAPYEYSLDGITWQSSNIFPGLIAGTYTVYYREVNGCQGTLSIAVGEPAALTASAATVPVVCNGLSNGIITITSGGGFGTHQYSIDGGTSWQSSNVFNVPAGTYTVIIRDANNCSTTQTITVTQPAALTAFSANGPASCDGGNDGLITVTAAGGNSGYQYSLDGINFQSSNVFNVAPGNYTVTVKDNLGCTTTFNTVVVLGSNFALTPQIDPTICEGRSTQLQLTSNATQYSWTPSTGLSSTTISNPVANPTVTTQYIVTATLGRCSGNDTVIVNVNAAPVPNAGIDGFICYGQTYQLQATGGTQYSWSPITYLNNPNIANPVSSATKDITYTLSILSDINGCASLTTDQVHIDVTPPIKVKTFPYDTVGYNGDRFQLLAVPSDNDVINYVWTPATGLSDPNIANPIVTAGAVGDVVQYKVTASTIAGCKGEGFVTVRVYKGPEIYMPTGFTPNGDGKNDKFTPFPVGIKSYKYFRVFNRWGQLVFSTTALHDGWDGKLGGRDQPSGVYVWMIEGVTKDGKLLTKKGTVSLIR